MGKFVVIVFGFLKKTAWYAAIRRWLLDNLGDEYYEKMEMYCLWLCSHGR